MAFSLLESGQGLSYRRPKSGNRAQPESNFIIMSTSRRQWRHFKLRFTSHVLQLCAKAQDMLDLDEYYHYADANLLLSIPGTNNPRNSLT